MIRAQYLGGNRTFLFANLIPINIQKMGKLSYFSATKTPQMWTESLPTYETATDPWR